MPEVWLHGEADDGDDHVPALANQHEHGPRDVPNIQAWIIQINMIIIQSCANTVVGNSYQEYSGLEKLDAEYSYL